MDKRVFVPVRRPVRNRSKGWLTRAVSRAPYWCDLCQLGDAMYAPFVEALKARFSHQAADIEARACLRAGLGLAELDAAYASTGERADTGLRVMGNTVWRYQCSGVCVCEPVAGERIVLIYEPVEATCSRCASYMENQK
ncbi:hypothetical protein R75461_07299 [Paraburkholderia nemoris]|uniref:hypothetical protein n=1 Tax=Paraburkholderia nemoris TaxID=2793076 RepID=UPI00190A9F84|nr:MULTISPECIES: hypothetical protein [Paraburkholderia]MBK3786049.1 hypothetical protein [Paraburkholderia aspalathi]CAE6847162.1 hypothetical protein R75461_07299 [Paraburkholderia nemoris]